MANIFDGHEGLKIAEWAKKFLSVITVCKVLCFKGQKVGLWLHSRHHNCSHCF